MAAAVLFAAAPPAQAQNPNLEIQSFSDGDSVNLVATFIAGTTDEWVIVVENSGGADTSTAVAVTLEADFSGLPATLTLGDPITTDWTPCTIDISKMLSCTLPASTGIPASGAADPIRIPVTVAASVPHGTTSPTVPIITAMVSGGGEPTSMLDNSASVTTTVNREADVGIVKIDSPDPVIAGNLLFYTIQVTNAGPSNANVVVTDTLPQTTVLDVTPISTSPILPFTGCSEGTGPASASLCTISEIPPGTSVGYIITVRVNSDAPIGADVLMNTAAVAIAAGAGAEPSVAPLLNSSTTLTTVNRSADLSISKSAPATVAAGGTLTYTITVFNNGPSDAAGVVVTDNLDDDTSFNTISGIHTCPSTLTGANDEPECPLGAIPSGTSQQYTMTVDVDPTPLDPPMIMNSASVPTTDDPVAGNNMAGVTTTVVEPVDLSITKSDDLDPRAPGDPLVYNIQVANNSAADATGVTVTDVVPANFTVTSTSGCGEESPGPGVGIPTCTLGTIDGSGTSGNNTKSFTVTGTVGSAEGTMVNTVSVTGDQPDLTPLNNIASETTLVQAEVDLSVTKIDQLAGPVSPNDPLIYRITVTNNSTTATANNVVVTDTLPGDVTFGSFSPVSGAGCAPFGTSATVPTCNIPTIAPSANAIFDLNVTVNGTASGTLINTVSVSGDETDPLPGDNLAAESTQVDVPTPEVDLSVTKIDQETGPVSPDATLIYLITVTNNSTTATANNVVVTDTLPGDVTFSSTTCVAEGGTAGGSATVPTCKFTTIAPGATPSFLLTVMVKSDASGTLINTVSVSGDETDPLPGDNLAAESTQVDVPTLESDLSITKTGSPDRVDAGTVDSLTYTITVANHSSDPATDVVVTDTLPSEVIFGFTNADTTCDNLTGSEVPDGPGVLGGSATVPTCTIPTIAAATSTTVPTVVSFDIVVDVDEDATGPLINVATASSDNTDPNPVDNFTTVTTQVNPKGANLQITKSDLGFDPVDQGGTVKYTITVANAADGLEATNVVVTDTLPGEVSFTSSSGDTCTAMVPMPPATGPTVLTCPLPDIPSGESESFTVTGTVSAGGTGVMTNIASVTAMEPDPDSGNNTTLEVTTVTPTLTPSVSGLNPPDIQAGEDTFQLVIEGNNLPPNPIVRWVNPNGIPAIDTELGDVSSSQAQIVVLVPEGLIDLDLGSPLTANNVVVTDLLPSDVTFSGTVADTTCDERGGTLGGSAIAPTCTFDQIAANTPVTFTLTVTANAGASGTLINAVSASSDETDPTPGNNSATLSTPVGTSTGGVNLSVVKTNTGVDPVNPGGMLTYEITVSNNSLTDAATGVVVTDALPRNATFSGTTCTAEGGTPGGTATVSTCTFGTIPANTSETFTLTAIVNANARGTLINTVSVSGNEADPASTDNVATESTQVSGPAAAVDLSVDKRIPGSGPVLPGDPVTYEITVTNSSLPGGPGNPALVQIIVGNDENPTPNCDVGVNCEIFTVMPSRPPVITGVSPTSVENLSTRTLSIGGSNFLEGATVFVWPEKDIVGNDLVPTETNRISEPLVPVITTPGSITVVVPGSPYFELADPTVNEKRMIGVKNPRNAGKLSAMQEEIDVLSTLAPAISGVDPTSACTDSSGGTIVISGLNFRAGSQV